MKIAFFWTWDFSTQILASLIEYSDIEVVLSVSQPDKPTWRKQEIVSTPLKNFSVQNNICIEQPVTLKNNYAFFEQLRKFDLDFIIVVAYWKIIPPEILQIPKYGSINIHWSILPFYRWASPIQQALKNWASETWLTIMYMSEGMDEWDILKIEKVPIDILDKTPDIFQKFQQIGPNLLLTTLREILHGTSISTPQDSDVATYCSKIEKQDGEIDFQNETAFQIYNKFRWYYPWPWIYSYFLWKKITITDCFYEENDMFFDDDFHLGDVVEFEDHGKNNIWILCNGWILLLYKVKLEWKKEMSIKDFVNWNKNFLEYNFISE